MKLKMKQKSGEVKLNGFFPEVHDLGKYRFKKFTERFLRGGNRLIKIFSRPRAEKLVKLNDDITAQMTVSHPAGKGRMTSAVRGGASGDVAQQGGAASDYIDRLIINCNLTRPNHFQPKVSNERTEPVTMASPSDASSDIDGASATTPDVSLPNDDPDSASVRAPSTSATEQSTKPSDWTSRFKRFMAFLSGASSASKVGTAEDSVRSDEASAAAWPTSIPPRDARVRYLKNLLTDTEAAFNRGEAESRDRHPSMPDLGLLSTRDWSEFNTLKQSLEHVFDRIEAGNKVDELALSALTEELANMRLYAVGLEWAAGEGEGPNMYDAVKQYVTHDLPDTLKSALEARLRGYDHALGIIKDATPVDLAMLAREDSTAVLSQVTEPKRIDDGPTVEEATGKAGREMLFAAVTKDLIRMLNCEILKTDDLLSSGVKSLASTLQQMQSPSEEALHDVYTEYHRFQCMLREAVLSGQALRDTNLLSSSAKHRSFEATLPGADVSQKIKAMGNLTDEIIVLAATPPAPAYPPRLAEPA